MQVSNFQQHGFIGRLGRGSHAEAEGDDGRARPDAPRSIEPRIRGLSPLGTFSEEAEALRKEKCWTYEMLQEAHEEKKGASTARTLRSNLISLPRSKVP